MRDDEFDSILTAPLPRIADNGFSRQVLTRINATERRFLAIEIAAAAAVLVLLVANMPVLGLSEALQKNMLDLCTSVPFAMACAALAATFVGMRIFAD